MKIGVAGLNASGKGEVVAFLERRSFFAASLSDVIRDDLARDGIEPTREHMIERGRALRERYGGAILAERAVGKLPPDRNHVLDSIRSPAEVEALRAGGDFRLLWIEASPEVRYERARARGRVGDADSFARFQELEAAELASHDPSAQQLLAVRELADEVVPNNEGIEELHARLERLLQGALFFQERPSWDEYFMNMARVAATRANCIKRKVGALVVADRRVISTGYNGTPRGVRNCNEGGCPRCAGAAEAGAGYAECLCSHAEENAITQAAYHGVSVRGATVYTTLFPCLICSKMIVNAGMREVVYDAPFAVMESARELLVEAGVKLRSFRENEGEGSG